MLKGPKSKFGKGYLRSESILLQSYQDEVARQGTELPNGMNRMRRRILGRAKSPWVQLKWIQIKQFISHCIVRKYIEKFNPWEHWMCGANLPLEFLLLFFTME